jgi:hypothetical protein
MAGDGDLLAAVGVVGVAGLGSRDGPWQREYYNVTRAAEQNSEVKT